MATDYHSRGFFVVDRRAACILPRRMSFRIRALVVGLQLLLGALVFSGCGATEADAKGEGAGDDDSAEEEDRATPVSVVAVEQGLITQTIASSSTVDSEARADVLVEVSGTVASLHIEEGDPVKAGQLLALLNIPALKGELQRAEASFARAKEEFGALKGLYDKGFIARTEYDEARTALDTAQATLDQAKESDRARRLTSPIAGTVSLRELRYGEAVSPGRLAFQVVDLSKLRVDVNLPEKDLAKLEVGQSVRVLSEVLPDLQATGRVARISPVVQAETGTVKVTIAVDPGAGRLRPGMFVHVDVVTDTHEEAFLLPKRALVYEQGVPTAYVVDGDVVSRRPLSLGFVDRDRVEITEGLALGDQVVVVGQGLLKDGATVRVVH